MKFSGLAFLATVASTAAGTWIFHPTVPADNTERYQVLDQPVSPKASEGTGVWFCTSRGWDGHCEHFSVNFEDCHTVNPAFDEKISGVGPDGGSECFFYSRKNCKVTDLKSVYGPVGYCGNSDLSRVDFEDRIRSFKCIPKGGKD